MRRDPYRVLGVSPGASSEDLHDAYRRLVKLHHPDRNGGTESPQRRFAEIQQAYEELRARRGPARPHRAAKPPSPSRSGWRRSSVSCVKRRRPASARGAAREAARDADSEPAPVTTEDSFGKILGDIREELADRISEGRRHPAVHRVSELIDDVVSRLDRR